MEKLIRALVVSAATTLAAAIILQQLDSRAPAEAGEPEGSGASEAEIDADDLEPAERKAMLAELEAQL